MLWGLDFTVCQAIVARVYQNEIDKKNKESILTNDPSFGGIKGGKQQAC